MDGKGCECFARCEADCVCGADWTPAEVLKLRAEIAALWPDADRYRWLKSQPALTLESSGARWERDGVAFVASHRLCAGHTAYAPYATLDETIDAALAAKGEA